jgi:hypothetical protein
MRELLNAYPAQSQGDKRGCSDSIAWREKGRSGFKVERDIYQPLDLKRYEFFSLHASD